MEVRREWNAIDLLVIINERNKKVVVAIENKIKTSEHSNQLQRYRTIIADEFKRHTPILIYLTPGDMRPSDDAWIPFNYDEVAELLSEILNHKKSVLSPEVYSFILQYLTMLRRHVVGNSEVEKIAIEIYKKHKQALDIIFQYKPDIYLELSEHIQNRLKNSTDIILDSAGKTYVRFTSKKFDALEQYRGEGWSKSKRMTLFEFTIYDKRIVLRLTVGPGEENYRKNLLEFFKSNRAVFKLADRKYLGAKWHTVYQKEFLQAKDFDDEDLEKLKEKIDKKFEDFINDDLPQMEDHIQKNWKQ